MEPTTQSVDNKQVRSVLRDALTLRTTCAQNGLRLNEEQLTLLGAYAERLLEWNKKINLISRRDEENFWTSHILHSLSVLFKVDVPLGAKVLDLGTGGGLPGVPLKIVRDDLEFTLVDSTQKKTKAVEDMLKHLGLKGIEVVWGRAEDLGKEKKRRHRYDLVVARAVSSLKDLIRWSVPFLKQEAELRFDRSSRTTETPQIRILKPTLIAYKGGNLENELGQTRDLPGVCSASVIDLTLNGSRQLEEGDKKLVLIDFVTGQKQKANK